MDLLNLFKKVTKQKEQTLIRDKLNKWYTLGQIKITNWFRSTRELTLETYQGK